MSKKQMLSEEQIGRFKKLAKIEDLSVLKESYSNKVTDPRREAMQSQQEAADPMAADPMAADPMAADPMAADPMAADPMAALPSGEPDGDELSGDGSISPEGIQAVIKSVLGALGVKDVDVEVDGEALAGGEEELPELEDEESEDEESEESDKKDEPALSEDALAERILRRVTARLVQEASKKKLSIKDKMKKKKEEKKDVKKKEIAEATSAKGGGPLLSKGGNKHDTFKGMPDMKYGKGEKGGSGDQNLEDAPAKSDNTVSYGKTNLATKGGIKKK